MISVKFSIMFSELINIRNEQMGFTAKLYFYTYLRKIRLRVNVKYVVAIMFKDKNITYKRSPSHGPL